MRDPSTALVTLLCSFLASACAAEPARPGSPSGPLAPAPGSPFAIGGESADIAVGDLDGDGGPDLVVAGDGGLTVLSGDGRGGFGGLRRVPVSGPTPHLVALGDVDGDGHLDAAITAHDSTTVTVLRGDGEGGLAPLPDSPFDTGVPGPGHNHGLALADVDGDGDPDLLSADQDHGTVTVLLSDGRGGFTPAPGSPFPAGDGPYPFAVGDLDGDGRPDLAVPGFLGTAVTLLRGDGEGGFRPFPSSPLETRPMPFHTALADLDADGVLDLSVSHNESARQSVFLGDGEGGFRAAPGVELAPGAWRIAVADLDGDGHLDLAGGARDDRVHLAFGNGDGTFRPGPALEAGDGPWTVVSADLDGDGRSDLLALGTNDGTVWAWLGRPSTRPTRSSRPPAAPGRLRPPGP